MIQIANFLFTVHLPVEENNTIFMEITSEPSLLKEQAHDWYSFLHLTLQEYFVARYASEHEQLKDLLIHRGDPWWEEVLLLYAGHVSEANALLQTLLGQKSNQLFLQEDVFHTNLLLAGGCLAAVKYGCQVGSFAA